MKKLIAVLLLLAIAVIVAGFYLGWFELRSNQHTMDNKVDLNLTIDPDKARADFNKATTVK